MSNSVRPHRQQPTRLHCPRDSPGKNTWVGCHFLLQCMKVKSESEVAQSCLTLRTPWTAAYQTPPSMGLSRQEYWSRLLFPSPGDLHNPGIQSVPPASPALAGRFFTTVHLNMKELSPEIKFGIWMNLLWPVGFDQNQVRTFKAPLCLFPFQE